jgi:cytochrome c oxidase subunit 2
VSRRWTSALTAATVVGASVLGGCSHRSPSMLDHHGPEASRVANVWWLMFVLATVVYVVVAGLVITAIVRGRRRAAAEDPDAAGDERFIWLGGIVLPVLVLAVLAVVTVTTTRDVRSAQAGELRMTVVGKRWWWDVSYPGTGVRTANELHVPVGRTVALTLESDNVIHSFWVPQLAGKVDLIPGQRNILRFTASSAGTYRGQCAEFCGIQHAHMAFVVIADPPDVFARWLARRSSGAGVTPTEEEAARGEMVFNRESCAGCHTIRGTGAQGTLGPDLTAFGGRRSIGAGTVPNSATNLTRWIRNSQSIKPGNLMPPVSLSAEDLRSLVTYLESLK